MAPHRSPDGSHLKPLPAAYTRTAIFLHWTIAALILVNIALIWSVERVPESWMRPFIDTHKSIGITVLGLALMRWLWRATHPAPALPAKYPRWEKWSAHAVHGTLYLLIVAIPLSGWMHDSAYKDAAKFPMKLFGLVPWPRIGWIMDVEPVARERLHDVFGAFHMWFAYILIALFVLHVAGALKHQFIDGEPELQRMTRTTPP